MDKKFIEQFGNETGCFKLKTARQKKRAVKTAEEKKLLQLHREREQIGQQQRSMGFVELDTPIIKGWKRYFVLREDVARSRNALFYQKILDKINTTEYCNRKDFKRKSRNGPKRTKKWEEIEQTVLKPEHNAFVKLDFNEKEKAMFEEKLIKQQWRKDLVKVFVFKEPWRFVFRIRQHIITKVKAIDAVLERRENEISDYLDKTNKCDKLSRLLGHNVSKWRNWNSKPKEKYGFKKKKLEQIIDESKKIDDANASSQKLA